MNTGRAISPVLRLVILMVTLVALTAIGSPALAAPRADNPLRLDDQITDRVDALGDREGEVAAALSGLRSQSGLQLFVVYVRSFSGLSGQEWADDTAQLSGLGENDGLLAVATGDRAYAYSFAQAFPLTGSQLSEVASIAIEPPLASNDWAGAAIGAAEGYGAALAGRPIPPPKIQPGERDPGGSNLLGGLGAAAVVGCVLLALVIVGLIVWLVVRARRAPARPSPAGTAAARSDPLAGLTDEELSRRANAALVEADDAIKTSDEELAFAQAQYGPDATASFATAVAAAKQDISRAFELRQQLDDSVPEDAATRRAMLAEIIQRTEAADQRLDAEADAFDALRALESRLDETIPQVTADRDARAARIPAVASTLDALRASHADSALQSVSDNVEQAQERIQFAASALSEATAAAREGNRSAAAVAVRGAQEAVGQAGTLLDAVDKLSTDLARVGDAVRAALADVDADIAAGRAVVAGTADGSTPVGGTDLAGEVARAEQVAAAVRTELAEPRPDPIAALRRLEEVSTRLDQSLANVRDAAQQAERARSALRQAITKAQAEISAVTDFVSTRRGAIGGEARTRLAEAQRHLDRALALAPTDPVAALAEAQQADSLAERAGQLARGDVDQWSTPGAGGGYGGGFGGSSGGGVAGAVLGGILLGGILGGGRGGGGFGGGWGGGGRGGFGGGWGGRSPGGFGGSSRRGGGGRF